MNTHDKNDGQPILTLTARQLSIVVASVSLMAFFIFIIGYFYGQKRAAEQFTYRVDQESLADQVYSSLCGLYDNKADDETAEDTEVAEKAELAPENKEKNVTLASSPAPQEVAPVEVPETKVVQSPLYYAQLVGFSTRDAANKCLTTLKAQGFNVVIQERASKNKKGAKVAWYQVVTVPQSDKARLLEDVEKVKRLAKIKDIRIVTA